jgi:hypothetical protein
VTGVCANAPNRVVTSANVEVVLVEDARLLARASMLVVPIMSVVHLCEHMHTGKLHVCTFNA